VARPCWQVAQPCASASPIGRPPKMMWNCHRGDAPKPTHQRTPPGLSARSYAAARHAPLPLPSACRRPGSAVARAQPVRAVLIVHGDLVELARPFPNHAKQFLQGLRSAPGFACTTNILSEMGRPCSPMRARSAAAGVVVRGCLLGQLIAQLHPQPRQGAARWGKMTGGFTIV
jgi:hypothetical protein